MIYRLEGTVTEKKIKFISSLEARAHVKLVVLTSERSFKMLSRICKHGRLRFGNGANQSVRTFNMLCSMKASCKSFLISCDMTSFNIDIFLVAGFCCIFKSRSSYQYKSNKMSPNYSNNFTTQFELFYI